MCTGTAAARRQATLIQRGGALAGIVTRGDLLRAQRSPDADSMSVLLAGTADPVTVGVDHTLHEAMNIMLQRDIGRLPVMAGDGSRRIVGYLGRAEILAARMRGQDEESRRERGPLLTTKSSSARS